MKTRTWSGFAALSAALLLVFSASAGVLREAAFTVDGTALAPAVGGTLTLRSFGDKAVSVEIASQSATKTGIVTYRGRTVGSPVNNASVVATENGFVATVTDPLTGNVLRFRLDGSSLSVREESRPASGRCGAASPHRHPTPAAGKRGAKLRGLTGDPLVDGAGFLGRGEVVTNEIDVMVCVDLSAKRWIEEESMFAGLPGAVDLFAADSVARCNNMYANTDLDKCFTFRLVGCYVLDSDCSVIRDGDGYVDSPLILEYISGEKEPESAYEAIKFSRLQLERDFLRADIVTFLVACGSERLEGTVGVGWSFSNGTIGNPTFADTACNVCLVEAVAIGNTMAHEIGHNMGAGHAKMKDGDNSGPQLYDYSTGYYFDVTNAEGNVFRHAASVMAYNSNGFDEENKARWGAAPAYADDAAAWNRGLFTETEFFSSPNHTFKYTVEDGGGARVVDSGVPVGTPTNDNTRILSLTYPLAANFRARGEEVLFLNEATNAYEFVRGAAIDPLELTCDYSRDVEITAITNLPPGLVFDGKSYTISGTPTKVGAFKVDVMLEAADGRDSEQSVLLVVVPGKAPDRIIASLEELRQFMAEVRDDDFKGRTVVLAADVDCGGERFNTGDPEHPTTFAGTFDGMGHKIYNFVNAPTGSGDYGYGNAMFDYAETGATIKNLTLEGTLSGSGAYSAPFVLAAEGPLSLVMENCHFRGVATNYYHAAGLVGFASPGEGFEGMPSVILTNCTVRGGITTTSAHLAGGLVAKGTGVLAYDCSVDAAVGGRWTVGGLIAEAYGCSFERCSFKGWLGSGSNVLGNKNGGCGGLVGFASNAVFRACSSDADIEWNIDTDPYDPDGRINSYNFTADGGAAGVTCGSSAFYDCTATGTLLAKHGYAGGFVGWTAGAEIFSNCTTSVTLQPDARYSNTHGHGGFASTVASSGALFVDCSTSSQGHNIVGGFFNNQHPRKGVLVGRNTFRRCHVENVPAESAGFCTGAWNCTFEGCTVRGGTGDAGFVYSAGRQPDNQWHSEYSYAQTSTYTDCSVHGTRAPFGFVEWSNYSEKDGHTNVFRRCRAGCVYGKSNSSGASSAGFGSTLNMGTLVEDCAAYGIADMGPLDAGFAESISVGTTVRRCVGAVYHRNVDVTGGGFAEFIGYGTTVEDCYAVYAPYASAVNQSGDNGWRYGAQGGFVRRTSIGYNADDLPIARCFALWPLSKPNSNAEWISGAFCGVTPYNTSTHYFEDCYRPEESAIGDCKNADAEGVEALSLAEFATATAATMPNYDFANVWHAPGAVGASSPYLDASVDENTNFWFFATVIGAEGKILINGEAPKEAYPAGAVLTVEAIADNPEMPFAGWIGDGFANPASRVTTYTVKNVGAIGARFCTPIYTVDDWTNMVHGIGGDSFSGAEAFALMNDLDFTDYIAKNGWNYVSPSGFYGKFFGQGHTIRGLVSTNGYFSNTRALFSKISTGAEIRDLTVESAVYPGSGIDNDYNTVRMAGLVCDVGSGSLISNCHTRVDCHGQFPPWAQQNAYSTSMYYGLARNVNGTGIRIIDCTVEGTMIGCSEVAGLIGSADITGSEIARCSATGYFCATNSRSSPYGRVSGLVGEITLRGGSTVRECFAAGIVDGAYYASGFAYKIALCDDQSAVRDCYSTAEVVTREGGGINDYGNATGFAQRIDDENDEGGVTIANCWFGGTARAPSENGHSYGFAWLLSGDVAFQNCAFVQSGNAAEQMEGTTDVTTIDNTARLSAASWAGYDIGGKWTMTAGKTTPYFAWSLKDGGFRAFAFDETPGTRISVPDSSEPGTQAPVAADAEDSLTLDTWLGATDFADAHAVETTFLADNHRTIRAAWKAADPPAALKQTVTFDGNGGTPASQQREYVQGGKYSPLPAAPVRMDFEFAGWSPVPEGGAAVTTDTVVTPVAARTFYAQWKAVVYDPIPEGVVTVGSTTNTYDGAGHGIITNVAPDCGIAGIALWFAESDVGAGSPPGEWFDAMPMITNAGQIKVWCLASAPGYSPVTMWASATVEPKPLANGMFTLLIEPPTHYNGMAQEPEVAAVDGSPSIITANDYDVEFTNNLNAGTATATFTGKRNYTGTATATFEIEPRPVTLRSWSSSWIYDGEVHFDHRVEAVNFVDGEGVTTNGFASIRDAGTTPNSFDYEFNEGTLSNNYAVTVAFGTLTVVKAWFDDEPGPGSVPPGGRSKFDGAPVVYDGQGHTIDVGSLTNAFNAAIVGDGTEYSYALDDGAGPVEPWADEVSVFTNAGEHVVWYRVTNPNYSNFVHAAKVTITPKDVNLAELSLVGVPVTYNGAAQEPVVSAVDGDPSIIGEDDYTVAYSDNVNAGIAHATVTGRNNYQGEVTLDFTIDPKELTADMIALAATELPYDGTEQKPEVAAVDGDPSIITTNDYDVAYADNVNVGTATVTVTGKRNYTGEVEKQFEITKRQVTLASADGSWTYDGRAHSNATVVATGFLDGQGVTAYNFATITDVGSTANTFDYEFAAGTISNNYEVVAVSNGTLTVGKDDINGGEEPGPGSVPPGGVSKFDVSATYDGQGHTIDIGSLTNAFNAAIVGDGTEYSYALDDGAGPAEPWTAAPAVFTNAGEHVVWYRVANPNYSNFVHAAKVAIAPRDIDLAALSLVGVPVAYNGTAQEPAVAAVDGDPSIIGEDDYTVAYSNNVNTGTAAATVTAQGNYCGGKELQFEITQTEITTNMVSLSETWFVYDGEAKEPTVTVKFGGAILPETDYSVSYSNNVEIGTAYVTVTGSGNCSGTAVVSFEISEISGEGSVTIPRSWRAGQTVTWTAKAAKGSVFAHWEGDFVGGLGLARNQLRNPSLRFVAPEASGVFDTNRIKAVFIALDSDSLSSLALSSYEPIALNEPVAGLELTDDSRSLVSATVSGLPNGLKFDRSTMAITGTPKKSGAFIVKVTAKNASGYQWAENVVLKVKNADGTVPPDPAVVPVPKRTAYYPLTVIIPDAAAGTATGTGVYAEGRKASVSAKPAKGRVFAGWYLNSSFTRPADFASGDYLKATQSVVIPGVRYLFARFVTTEEDAAEMRLAVNGVDLAAGSANPPYPTNVMCGVYFEWPVAATTLSLATVRVTGLPAGLKFTDKPITSKIGTGAAAVVVTNVPAFTIYGAPTAASKKDRDGNVVPSQVKVTVTTAGKNKAEYVIALTVDPIDPDWAVGTFNGGEDDCQATLTVAANGKVSGKLLEGGRTWTLSAPYFDSFEGGVYAATVTVKLGQNTFTWTLELDSEYGGHAALRDAGNDVVANMVRTDWKSDPWKSIGKTFPRNAQLEYDTRDDDDHDGKVTLKFAASGAVTTKGVFVIGKDARGNDVKYTATGTAVLVPFTEPDPLTGAFTGAVWVYFPPKQGKFPGYVEIIGVKWDGVMFDRAPLP